MSIASISSIPAIGSITSSQQVNGPVSRTPGSTSSSTAGTVAGKPASAASSSAAAAAKASSDAVRAAHDGASGASSSGSSGGGVSASASAASDLIAAVYTTTVGGKTYTGSVEESDGEYFASVPGLAGASASGASVGSAETALGTLISVLA